MVAPFSDEFAIKSPPIIAHDFDAQKSSPHILKIFKKFQKSLKLKKVLKF